MDSLKVRHGVSLVDVLMAVGLFAVVFLALLGLYPMARRAVEGALALNGAIFLAERILEQERALPYDQIVSEGPLQVGAGEAQAMKRHGNVALTPYQYQIMATPVPDNLTPAAKSLVVMVSWTTQGSVRTVQLETEVVGP